MGFNVSGISHSVRVDFCICLLLDPLHSELAVNPCLDSVPGAWLNHFMQMKFKATHQLPIRMRAVRLKMLHFTVFLYKSFLVEILTK